MCVRVCTIAASPTASVSDSIIRASSTLRAVNVFGERTLTHLSVGSHFGERALIHNNTNIRSASIYAITANTITARVDPPQFHLFKQWRTHLLLQELPLLQSLPKTEQKYVRKRLKYVQFEDMEVIVRQGDVGDQFYIIVTGEAEVVEEAKQAQSLAQLSLTVAADALRGVLASVAVVVVAVVVVAAVVAVVAAAVLG